MSVTQKTEIGDIDLTPTWAQQTANCIIILKNSSNPDAIRTAENELLRIARIIDSMVEAKKTRILNNRKKG